MDEVQTGVGRTGKMWGYENTGAWRGVRLGLFCMWDLGYTRAVAGIEIDRPTKANRLTEAFDNTI